MISCGVHPAWASRVSAALRRPWKTQRCGSSQAIKELANRLDGKPAQVLDLSDPDSNPIKKIVTEIVHVNLSPEELSALNEAEKLSAEPMPIERHRANGNGGLNEDTEGRLK
jgi:hypothetical protein